ncbi:class I SAM-dependent methyltransferase [Amycolatopsis sp. 3B14]|uniref:class I SAM-dependent methyltransferase n=1 Tax=Amycolatopsis sp. 3B14 TaxID=3243600 RepID=UPI003D95F90D
MTELLAYGDHPVLAGARVQTTLRSRITEDRLHASGLRQYVVLGAGLDTFAQRDGRVRTSRSTTRRASPRSVNSSPRPGFPRRPPVGRQQVVRDEFAARGEPGEGGQGGVERRRGT